MKESRTVSIWLRPETDEEVSSRGDSRSFVITRDLERLYTLYGRALRVVELSVSEAWFIVDMLNGTIMDANAAGLLWASAEDACALDGLDEKWKLDGKAFVQKLKNLSGIQAMALVDAAERFWQANNTGEASNEDLKRFFGAAVKE